MKEIFEEANREFIKIHEIHAHDFWTSGYYETRRQQALMVINSLNDKFKFDKLMTLETGATQNMYGDSVFGLFLGLATKLSGGKMVAVELDNERVIKSKEMFSNLIPDLDYKIYCDDSVHFLENITEIPNLVHLDSYDCYPKNPLPSSLHAFREFQAIESKMEPGSIIMVDDNFLEGSWIDWIYPHGIERITITHPIMGKGALVYHHIGSGKSKWQLIGEHYNLVGVNIKVIIQKQ